MLNDKILNQNCEKPLQSQIKKLYYDTDITFLYFYA